MACPLDFAEWFLYHNHELFNPPYYDGYWYFKNHSGQ